MQLTTTKGPPLRGLHLWICPRGRDVLARTAFANEEDRRLAGGCLPRGFGHKRRHTGIVRFKQRLVSHGVPENPVFGAQALDFQSAVEPRVECVRASNGLVM